MDKKYLQGHANLTDFEDEQSEINISPSELLNDGLERDTFEQAIFDYLRDTYGKNPNGYNVTIVVSDIDWDTTE